MVKGESRQLVGNAVCSILAATLLGVAAAWLARAMLDLDRPYLSRIVILLCAGGLLLLWRLPAHHPFERLGIANHITIARGVLVALLAGLIGMGAAPRLQVAALCAAVVAAVLDAVDGWLARRTRMSSSYGARFDMETDALLILVLSILAWQFGKAGFWVLGSGLLRYGFVAAAWFFPWMHRALPPSRRRKAVAVIQIVALLIAIATFVPVGMSTAVCAAALAVLAWSFFIDVAWLRQRASTGGSLMAQNLEIAAGRSRAWDGFTLFAALVLLNSLLTFHNVWPTLFIHWPGELSIEFACVLLLLAAWHRLRGAPPPALLAVLATLFVLGTLGRYGEVTAPALYGRDVNLYFDLPHVASLVGMLVNVVSIWVLAAIVIAIVAVFALLYLAAHWSLRRISDALGSPRLSAAAGIAAILMIGWFTLQRLDEQLLPRMPQFSIPVSKTYTEQLTKVVEAVTGSGAVRKLPPSPALSSTLSLSAGSDVMVVFLESYGRATYDRPEFFQTLTAARADLDNAVRETGRVIVSGFVESPTFGGGSWLAHISFLSGIEVRDPGRGQLLMTQQRRTFGTELARHGYRTVALMPGLKSNWPEGVFYGFDQIYDDAGLDYRGPAFGWWRIPDQFSLAKLDALEIAPRAAAPSRQPLFMFFPTISMHAPFRPTPPYQADWSRILGDKPFDAAALQASLPQRPEWNNMGTSYVGAVEYSLQTLAGYLRTHSKEDLIMIVLGDHQPAAMVSGENASWDVPVHVIASKPALLAALQGCGFVKGMVPSPVTLGPMHRLGPALLSAFEAPASTTAVENEGAPLSSTVRCQLAEPSPSTVAAAGK